MSNVWERFEGIVTVGEVEEQQKSMIKLNAGVHIMTLEKVEATEDDNGIPAIIATLKTVAQDKPIKITQKLQGADPSKTAWMIAKGTELVQKLLGQEIKFTTLGSLANDISKIVCGDGTQYEVNVVYRQSNGKEYTNYEVIGKVAPKGEMNEFDSEAGEETDF